MTKIFTKEHPEQIVDMLEFLKTTYEKADSCHIFIPKSCDTIPERYQKTYRPTKGERIIGIIIKHEQMGHKNFAGHTPPLSALHMMFELAMLHPFIEIGGALNWPDDVVIKHKAIATLFSESILEQGKVVGMIGIINLHLNNHYAFSSEYYHTNTSAKAILNKEVDEDTYINNCLTHLDELYQIWESKQYPQLYTLWKEKQGYLNETVTFYHNIGMVMRGQILDFLSNGDMLLHDENGKNHTIHYLQIQESNLKK
jgi:biotin-(acetyl-CoA carboxylase) ligase